MGGRVGIGLRGGGVGRQVTRGCESLSSDCFFDNLLGRPGGLKGAAG